MTRRVRPAWESALAVGSLLRRRGFDTGTAEGRSRERYRRIALTSFSSVGVRGVSMLAKLLIVPVAIGYLGTEDYGLLVAISALTAWLSLADLGFGNGVRNVVAGSYGQDDDTPMRQYVATAYLALAVVGSALAVGYLLVQAYIPWMLIFNTTSESATDIGPAMAVFVTCVLLSLPLTVGSHVRAGYQEGYITNWYDAAASVIGLLGVLVVTRTEGGLVALVAAIAGSPVLALLANNAGLFVRARPWLRPRLRDVRSAALRQIGRTGVAFFVLQAGATVVMFTDVLVVAQLFGATEIAAYAVPWQLFSALTLVVGMLLMPFWPAYAEAVARGDVNWVAATLRRSFGFALGASAGGAVTLVVAGPLIITIWVGEAVQPSPWLLAALGLTVVISMGVGAPIGIFLNGLGKLSYQMIWIPFAIVTNLGLSVVLGRWIGLPGVALGTAIAELVFGILPFVPYIPHVLAELRRRAVITPDHVSAPVPPAESDIAGVLDRRQ